MTALASGGITTTLAHQLAHDTQATLAIDQTKYLQARMEADHQAFLRKFLKFVPDAQAAQGRSKDPSTQVGAVALDDDFNLRASGYNGFPRGVNDDPGLYADREKKYPASSMRR